MSLDSVGSRIFFFVLILSLAVFGVYWFANSTEFGKELKTTVVETLFSPFQQEYDHNATLDEPQKTSEAETVNGDE